MEEQRRAHSTCQSDTRARRACVYDQRPSFLGWQKQTRAADQRGCETALLADPGVRRARGRLLRWERSGSCRLIRGEQPCPTWASPGSGNVTPVAASHHREVYLQVRTSKRIYACARRSCGVAVAAALELVLVDQNDQHHQRKRPQARRDQVTCGVETITVGILWRVG